MEVPLYLNAEGPTAYDGRACSAAPPPMMLYSTDDLSTSEQLLSEASDDLEYTFAGNAALDRAPGPLSCTDRETATTSRTLSISSEIAADLLTVKPNRRLKHPTPYDWQHWRHDIVRQYSRGEVSAPAIVNRLRREGYKVTIKMLRDRLREWGAATKQQRRSGSIAALAIEPSRALNTSAADAPQCQLLKSIEGLFHNHWERSKLEGSLIPYSGVMTEFRRMAFPATRQGTPKAWRCMRGLAFKIWQADWSLISPCGLMRLGNETMRFFQNSCLVPMQDWWISIFTHGLPGTHPVVLLLDFLRRNSNNPDPSLWHALGGMHEYMATRHENPHARGRSIGEARYVLATILMHLDQGTEADGILHRYSELADGETATGIDKMSLCHLSHVLGQSSHRQRRHKRAVQHLKRAGTLDQRTDVGWTVSNTRLLAESLLLSGDAMQAAETLQELLHYLQTNVGLQLVDEADYVKASYEVSVLCDDLSGFAELGDIIQHLRDLQIKDAEEDL